MFIRQLGLKAYMNFPGAIHTRYSHALGTMQLAGNMVDMLSTKMKNKGKQFISQNLIDNRNNVMAAGFLHDIGHAPFSHAADFVLKLINGKTHEEMTEEIIRKKIPNDIENWGITKSSVIQLIGPKSHSHPFLHQIIDGPLDCDKLDYLLRDAYHVGLRYSFDLSHFLRSYTIIGSEDDMPNCILGLDFTKQAVVTAELFVVIWKSMYDLVYLIEQSRIAEKMLEKAFLLCATDTRQTFQLDAYVEADDESMLSQLKKKGAEIVKLIAAENPRLLYVSKLDNELTKRNFRMSPEFLAKLEEDPDQLSEHLSLRLAEELQQEKYSIICDIIKSRTPRRILLDHPTKAEYELRNESDIVDVIAAKNVIKVYISPTIERNIVNRNIKEKLKNLVKEETEFD
jgi:HD superfamily phosphohydrolase